MEDNLEQFPAQDVTESVPEQNPLLQWTDELTEEKVTAKLRKYNSSWDSFSEKLHPEMRNYLKLYGKMENVVSKEVVKIPEVFQIIETELPHLCNSLFSATSIVDASPKFSDPGLEKTYKIKNYVNRCIKDLCDGRRKTEYLIKNMLIYGWGVVKIVWNTEPEKDIDPVTKQVVDVNSAHPDFDVLDNFSFGFDPNFEGFDINELEWVKHRIFISKDKLKQMRDNGECGNFSDNDMSTTEDKGKNARKGNGDETKNDNITYYDEFWTTLFYKNEEGKYVSSEYKAWFLANNKTILFEKNLYARKPFCLTRAYASPNEFLGMGEAQVIGALSTQLSYVNYQAGKLIKKIGQHLTFIEPSSGLSPENVKRIEDGIIFCDNKDGIRMEETTDSSDVDTLVKYKLSIDEQIEKITGVNKFLQGEIVGQITATEAQYVQANSSNRLAMKLVHLQEDFIVPLAEIFFMFSKQLLTTNIDFFDSNNNMISLLPEDFTGNYNWKSDGAISQSNKVIASNQNQAFLAGLLAASKASMGTPTAFFVDQLPFIEQFIAPYNNIPSLQSFIIGATPPMGSAPPNGQLPPLGPAPVTPNAPAAPQGHNVAPGSVNSSVQQVPNIEQTQPLPDQAKR